MNCRLCRGKLNRAVSPEQAVEGLAALHATAMGALRLALDRFVAKRSPPSPDERSRFRYPELRLIWDPLGPRPFTWRALGKVPVAWHLRDDRDATRLLPALLVGAAPAIGR